MDACVNFACKRPNYADVGEGGKRWQNFADVLDGCPRTPYAPKLNDIFLHVNRAETCYVSLNVSGGQRI